MPSVPALFPTQNIRLKCVWDALLLSVGLLTSSYQAYFARAKKYLRAVLTPQNSTTVQALLVLCQFQCRATGGPSIWYDSILASVLPGPLTRKAPFRNSHASLHRARLPQETHGTAR